MTALNWDHTVHYVNDLQAAINVFEKNGLHAFAGGSHKQWGTYNVLSYFGLCYLEFLGVEDLELARKNKTVNCVVSDSVELLPEREIIGRIAIRTTDIEETAASLQTQGMKVSPIIDGRRLNAHGELIEWRMMTIKGDYQGLGYPFVIQWMGEDTERLEKMTAAGVIQPHQVGDVEIKSAVFRVANPIEVAIHWQKLFGLPVLDETPTEMVLGIGGKSFIFKQGNVDEGIQLVFQTDSPSLKGRTITIGNGEYSFV